MRHQNLRLSVVAVAIAALTAACGATAKDDNANPSDPNSAVTGLRVMVPNSPGSGYDTTGRVAVKVMEDSRLTSGTEVFNLSGAGGTVGLARLVREKGNADLAMVMGLGVVGATYTNKAPAKLDETTPIARLISEAGAILVGKQSPYQTLDQLVAAWKADPKKVSVGGGSSPGGPDHLLPMQFAAAIGIDPRKVNYVAYDGGGDLLPALLGNKVSFATSGAGEFAEQIKSGDVRILAVSSKDRLKNLPEVKTLIEQKIDLEFINWRGVVAPGGLTAAQTARWVGVFDRMHATPAWRAALERNGWTDAYLSGDAYATFLREQNARVDKTLTELGLA